MTRQSPRFTVQLDARISGDAKGRGVIYNLSLDGCQIESLLSIQAGMTLTVVADLDRTPLTIKLATVRWSNPPYVGVQFVAVEPQEQARLAGYLNTLFGPSPAVTGHEAAPAAPLQTVSEHRDGQANSISGPFTEGIAIEQPPVRDERQIVLPFFG